MAILRNVLAVVVGFLLGSWVNLAFVTAGPKVIALPAGVDTTTPEGLIKAMPLLEPKHFIFPFLAHALGTLIGATVAHLAASSRRSIFSFIIGVLFMAGGIIACFMFPAPKWFLALDLIAAYLPMAWLGTRIGRSIRPETAPVTS